MEDQLFVRIRGRVQGPYEVEKLRTLVRRGQLSRMHEVSSDGSVWKQAAEYPELFISPTINDVRAHAESSAGSAPEDNDIPDVERPATMSSGRWHYAQNSIQLGPVSFEELKSLIASGNVDSTDLVWADGMKEWVPANSVQGLLPISFAGTNSQSTSGAKIGGQMARTLSESRPWIMFIGSVVCIVGTLMLVLGAGAVIMGARWHMASTIAGGGFSIAYAIVLLWGGLLLNGYGTDLGKVQRDNSIKSLDTAFRSLRRFWIFLSVILIVCLVNAIAAAIWIFSIGVSLSGP